MPFKKPGHPRAGGGRARRAASPLALSGREGSVGPVWRDFSSRARIVSTSWRSPAPMAHSARKLLTVVPVDVGGKPVSRPSGGRARAEAHAGAPTALDHPSTPGDGLTLRCVSATTEAQTAAECVYRCARRATSLPASRKQPTPKSSWVGTASYPNSPDPPGSHGWTPVDWM